jgi:fatty acid kinase
LKIENINAELFKKALSGAASLLEDNKEEINSLNVFPVPDGDTGTNMSLTMQSALKQGLSVEDKSVYKIALATSKGSLMGARGNSGVILSQLFRGFADELKGKDAIDVKTLARSLQSASDTAYKAVMKPTEGTILTVARESAEFGMSISREEKDIINFLKRVIDKANKTLNKTPEMLSVLKEAGVVDAGGKGFVYVLLGAYNALSGIEDFTNIEFREDEIKTQRLDRKEIVTDDILYGYCTEFMINTDDKDIEEFRDKLSVYGDSLMVVGADGLIKVHVHTNNPGIVLEKALKKGELKDIKIDNMRYQHEEILLNSDNHTSQQKNESKEKKKYSFVSVSIGDGIDEVFKGLNVDYIVKGGQTMNPSTEDIFNAIESTKGENVIILPNNSNIVLAANQSKELTDRNVHVLNTKSIPEGIAALLAFDEDREIDENLKDMQDSIENVLTGQVTYAVRDTEFKENKISKDDIIGIADGDIVSKGEDINDVGLKLIKKMINEDVSIITIFYGIDISKDTAEELASILEKNYEDIDIEIVFGGQPLYYYIFSLE